MITAVRVVLHLLQAVFLVLTILGAISTTIAASDGDHGPNDAMMAASFTLFGILTIAFSPALWSIPPVRRKEGAVRPAAQPAAPPQHHAARAPHQPPYGGPGR